MRLLAPRPAYRRLLNLWRRPRAGRFGGRRPARLTLEALESRTLLTGTWTALTNPAPETGVATMMLLSDGTVMAVASTEEHIGRDWYQLTPDAFGNYAAGTWSALAPMHDTRVYFPSAVLPDGRVFVGGGEYGSGAQTAEVYDPLADSWTPTPRRPLGDIGDSPSEMLPDGRVLVGSRQGAGTNVYDPATNTWTTSASKLRGANSTEESWVLLPDQSILTVEISRTPHAQRYLPAEDRWIDAGAPPFALEESSEIGPALLLPDGRAFFVGANGRTAFYTPSPDPYAPGSWAAGPSLPNNLAAWDVPAAMMPNGHVLLVAGPHSYDPPITVLEYDPGADTFTPVDSPAFPSFPYEARMLMLPSGQVLVCNGDTQLWVYTPDGAPDPAWQPTIREVDDNGDGTFLLWGTQLNGLSEGAAYGDDAEMSSNYPIIQLVDPASGQVYFARTFDWSSTGVATGDAPESTYFTLPPTLGPGTYSLSVIANGIASDPVDFTIDAGAGTASIAVRAGAGIAPAASGAQVGHGPVAPPTFSNEPGPETNSAPVEAALNQVRWASLAVARPGADDLGQPEAIGERTATFSRSLAPTRDHAFPADVAPNDLVNSVPGDERF